VLATRLDGGAVTGAPGAEIPGTLPARTGPAVIAGLTANGLVMTGLMTTGLIPTELVTTGLTPTGLVTTGLVMRGLVTTGVTPTGLVMTGRTPGAELLGPLGRLPTRTGPDPRPPLPPRVLGSEPGPETATQSQTRSVWQFDNFPPPPGAAVQAYSFFQAHWYFVGPVRGWADAVCGMSCMAPTMAKHISEKRPRCVRDLRGRDLWRMAPGVVMSITDLGQIDPRIVVINKSPLMRACRPLTADPQLLVPRKHRAITRTACGASSD
jgi:hypothetical protein